MHLAGQADRPRRGERRAVRRLQRVLTARQVAAHQSLRVLLRPQGHGASRRRATQPTARQSARRRRPALPSPPRCRGSIPRYNRSPPLALVLPVARWRRRTNRRHRHRKFRPRRRRGSVLNDRVDRTGPERRNGTPFLLILPIMPVEGLRAPRLPAIEGSGHESRKIRSTTSGATAFSSRRTRSIHDSSPACARSSPRGVEESRAHDAPFRRAHRGRPGAVRPGAGAHRRGPRAQKGQQPERDRRRLHGA